MKDNLRLGAWSPCDHLRVTDKSLRIRNQCPPAKGWPDLFNRVALADWLELEARLLSLEDDVFRAWLDNVMSNVEIQFPPALSLAVSLAELRHGLKEALPTWQDLRQNAAGNFLKIKFGIEPFLRDLRGMCQVWGKFKSRLNFLQDTRGKTYVERRKRTYEATSTEQFDYYTEWEFTPVPPPPPPPPPAPPPVVPSFLQHECAQWYRTAWADGKWIATAIINNMLGDMGSLVKQADAFGRVVGLGNSPKIAWNVTKWSWLVDWAVDTDSILDRFGDTGPFDGKLALNGFYLSSKLRAMGEVMNAHAHCAGEEWQNNGSYLLRKYVRSGDFEATNVDDSLIQPSLNGDQRQILLALLIQRTRAVPDWVSLWRKIRR